MLHSSSRKVHPEASQVDSSGVINEPSISWPAPPQPAASAPHKTLFVCLGARVRRLSIVDCSKAQLSMQIEQLYLGTGSGVTALTEPLCAMNLFCRHPQYGVFYLNWTVQQLQDGDVLLVQHHDEFFTAANQGARQVFKPADPGKEQEGANVQAVLVESMSWRQRMWQFFTDPTYSWCAPSVQQQQLRILPSQASQSSALKKPLSPVLCIVALHSHA